MTNPDAPPILSVIPMPPNVDDLPMPDNGPYYIMANKRMYLHKRIHQGRVILPVDNIPSLPDPMSTRTKGFFWYDEEKILIPAEIVGKVWSFFRSIYNQRGSEAMVNLTWHAEHGMRVFVPPQQASGGGVQSRFEPGHLLKGSRVIGTIHSHCDFSAFHSGTDTHDGESHDGIHMTIGKVKSNPPEIATMVMIGGKQWDFKPEQVIDGELDFIKHPRWWERYVLPPERQNANRHISQWSGANGIKHPTKDNKMPVSGGSQTTLPFARPGNASTKTGTAGATRPPTSTGTGTTKRIAPPSSATDQNDDISSHFRDILDVSAWLEYNNVIPTDEQEIYNQRALDLALAMEELEDEARELGIEIKSYYQPIDTKLEPNWFKIFEED